MRFVEADPQPIAKCNYHFFLLYSYTKKLVKKIDDCIPKGIELISRILRYRKFGFSSIFQYFITCIFFRNSSEQMSQQERDDLQYAEKDGFDDQRFWVNFQKILQKKNELQKSKKGNLNFFTISYYTQKTLYQKLL